MRIRTKIYSLLRQSEKWTKTDMVYLAKGGFWISAGKVVASAASFALSVAFANLISQENYGIYKYITSAAGVLAIFALTGMENSLTRSVARGYDGSLFKALKEKIRWGFLGSIISVGLAGYYLINGNVILGASFFIAAVFLPFIDSIAIYGAYLGGKKLFRESSIYSAASQSLATAALIASLLLTSNIILIIFAYFASYTLFRAIFFFQAVKKNPPNTSEDPETISYGKHLSLMNVIGGLAGQLDKILMWHFLGPVSLAIYSFALAPVNQLKTLNESINPLALPKISAQDRDIIKKTLPVKVLKMLLPIGIIAIAYAAAAPFLFKLFFPQYLEAIAYSQVFAVSLFFSPQKMFGISLTAHGQKKALYFISVSTPIIKIILLASLIPLLGIGGAIISLLASSLYSGIALYYFFSRA